MDITGSIEVIKEVQQISDTFWKREFVIKYMPEGSQYEELIKFELLKEKCSLVDELALGDQVKVHFNISGRKWTNPKGEEVYFNSLKAWKIEKQSDDATESKPAAPPVEGTQGETPSWLNEPETKNDDDDAGDLPF